MLRFTGTTGSVNLTTMDPLGSAMDDNTDGGATMLLWTWITGTDNGEIISSDDGSGSSPYMALDNNSSNSLAMSADDGPGGAVSVSAAVLQNGPMLIGGGTRQVSGNSFVVRIFDAEMDDDTVAINESSSGTLGGFVNFTNPVRIGDNPDLGGNGGSNEDIIIQNLMVWTKPLTQDQVDTIKHVRCSTKPLFTDALLALKAWHHTGGTDKPHVWGGFATTETASSHTEVDRHPHTRRMK